MRIIRSKKITGLYQKRIQPKAEPSDLLSRVEARLRKRFTVTTGGKTYVLKVTREDKDISSNLRLKQIMPLDDAPVLKGHRLRRVVGNEKNEVLEALGHRQDPSVAVYQAQKRAVRPNKPWPKR